MNRSALTTREDFDYWVSDMEDALERFFALLPSGIHEKLDFSPPSLEALEEWILGRYPNTQTMLQRDQAQILDGAARYIGETFRRAIGGYWSIRLDDPKMAFFGVPILTGFEERSTPACPLALATASADRRTGTFLHTVLKNYMKGLRQNKN